MRRRAGKSPSEKRKKAAPRLRKLPPACSPQEETERAAGLAAWEGGGLR